MLVCMHMEAVNLFQAWQNLMSMMNQYSSSTNEKLFGKNIRLIDSAAPRHMTVLKHLLSNVSVVEPCYIELPDGSQILSNSKGHVNFGSTLFSIQVLYVPNLKCNLLSIS